MIKIKLILVLNTRLILTCKLKNKSLFAINVVGCVNLKVCTVKSEKKKFYSRFLIKQQSKRLCFDTNTS